MPQKSSQKHIVIDARIRRASTGRYVDRLIEHLQVIDQTNRYTILVEPDDNWQPTAVNFTRKDAPFAQFSLNPLQQFQFAGLLYGLKADVVHFPLNQQPLLYFRPVVTSTLDLTMLNFTRAGKTPLPLFKLKMLAYRFLFWYSNKKSKAIITISNYVKNDLAKHYIFTVGKTVTTYCASEPPNHVPPKRPTFVEPKTPFLLYVGTAFPHKNLSALVQAAEQLHAMHPKLHIYLVGKKEQYYEKLDRFIAKREAQGYITTTGFLEDAELNWLYAHARGYVFPSLSEGFGLPGLEAMAHSTPVISSNATCLPEVYGDAALYFNPENIDDIVLKIDRLLRDKDLQKQLVARGHKQLKNYSWRTMAQETLAVYQKVLS